ncbi:ATPase [Stygiolobus caldivivus]|uniref:ATPase n=1 Tax=Stygiolobus caldivivus TaxID=2824673 RepID=A0A8D5U7S7_9CREN|nr:ATPase [Stygiolobus caldivivus]BCU71335.1 ATPase [Stygiolobus caldivivus]
MAEQYINMLKIKLDEKKKEILAQLNAEFEKIVKQRTEDFENIKRNILKEVEK